MSKGSPENLEKLVEKLTLKLEDEPDPWFGNPRGYLKKPRYGREAQDRALILKGPQRKSSLATMKSLMTLKSAYQNRYFILDVKGQKLSYYKADEANAEEKGNIDMRDIIDIQYSAVFDAPDNSLDIISNERHFTIVADSKEQLIRWATALNTARPDGWIFDDTKLDVEYPNGLIDDDRDETLPSRWTEFEVLFNEPVPLMLNIVGMINRDKDGKFVNNLLAVASFDFYPDGSAGPSEQTGMIGVKDFLVRVNDADLTKGSIPAAMATISNASWPKTLHFLRDNLGNRDGPKIEGWTYATYPALKGMKLRYIELVHDTLNFYKAELGGTVSANKDACFKLSQGIELQPIINLSKSDNTCVIKIKCKPGSLIHHFRYGEEVIRGSSYVETLELSFTKVKQLNRWRSALVSPFSTPEGINFHLTSLPVDTYENQEEYKNLV